MNYCPTCGQRVPQTKPQPKKRKHHEWSFLEHAQFVAQRERRLVIACLRASGWRYSWIAKAINRHPLTAERDALKGQRDMERLSQKYEMHDDLIHRLRRIDLSGLI